MLRDHKASVNRRRPWRPTVYVPAVKLRTLLVGLDGTAREVPTLGIEVSETSGEHFPIVIMPHSGDIVPLDNELRRGVHFGEAFVYGPADAPKDWWQAAIDQAVNRLRRAEAKERRVG